MIRYATVSSLLLPLFRRKLRSISGAQNLPRSGPVILAANHVDFLDGFFIAAAVHARVKRPLAILTKTNNYWWTGATIAIDSENRGASLASAVRYLRSGWLILNFVEGVRNTGSTIAFGKTGTARLAASATVPVLPVGISGFTGRNMVDSLTRFLAQPPRVRVRIGPVIPPPHDPPDDRAAMLAYTRRILTAIAPLAGKT
jgi:1-acyl-sn-glycerol-3-phosphate acyltransferase